MPALTVADALARVLDGAVPGSIERVMTTPSMGE